MSFVVLDKSDFEEWASLEFSKSNNFTSWEWKIPTSGIELVICAHLKFPSSFEAHIYTTLDRDEKTRDIGKDAIRVVLYDSKAGKAVAQFPKVLRTEGGSSVFERLCLRIQDLLEIAAQHVKFCKKCGAHLVKRINRATNTEFMACNAFPNCGKTLNHPLKDPYNGKQTPVIKSIETRSTVGDIIPMTPVAPASEQTILVDEEDCFPSTHYPHFKYPFEHFNRVQSTILKHGYWNQDCNLVLGTATSTGKTISGELFVWETLKVHKKKVCYVSPLKSLTLEKFNDWNKTFGQKYKICILTGDFVLTEERAEELNDADLICLTSEMVDSRTRNYRSERSDWLFDVGLVITDESHIISTSRGHAVEVGLMRFCKLVPTARILMLSATMPNVDEFQVWLTNLNGKKTNVINNSWRPTRLEWHFIQHETGQSYARNQGSKIDATMDCLNLHPGEKYLVFVHDKNTGRTLENYFTSEGVNCKFHNADLELESRVDIEDSFESREEDSLRVLISTSTLAWGRNLPAVNVIIVGVNRGIMDVDELDIIQMAGRAGRLGWSDVGRCYLICDSAKAWKNKVSHPRNIRSTLLDVNVLGFHILAEIANQEIYNKASLFEWFSRSLAAIQIKLDEAFVNKVLAELERLKMITIEDDGRFNITALGRISASLYFYPKDVSHWSIMFGIVNDNNLWRSDLAVSYALGTTPTWQLSYVPKNEASAVEDYIDAVVETVGHCFNGPAIQSVIASDLYNVLTEQQGTHLYARNCRSDIERISGALHWINSLRSWGASKKIDILSLRVKYGVRAGLAVFCQLPNIGVQRARILESHGFKSLRDIVKNKDTVIKLLGANLGTKAVDAAARMVKSL